MEMINLQSAKYESIVDFFKIVQIGLFRSNIISVKQLSELAYMIIFEHFESDNVLVIVEINNYGNELMAHLPNVFDGNNNYGYFPFLKYKHRVDATDEKVGLKITGNKNLLVKDYQDRMLTHNIVINNEDTIGELTIFIKHITPSGNIIYSADGSGNDDQSMTVVHSATVFKHPRFRQMVEEMLDKDLDPQISSYVKSILNVIDEYTGQGNDYKQLLEIRKRQIMMKQLYK
jgi:predicted HTH domain antitoxin